MFRISVAGGFTNSCHFAAQWYAWENVPGQMPGWLESERGFDVGAGGIGGGWQPPETYLQAGLVNHPGGDRGNVKAFLDSFDANSSGVGSLLWAFNDVQLGPDGFSLRFNVACDASMPWIAAIGHEVVAFKAPGLDGGVEVGQSLFLDSTFQLGGEWTDSLDGAQTVFRWISFGSEDSGLLEYESPDGLEPIPLSTYNDVRRTGGPGEYRLRLWLAQPTSAVGIGLLAALTPLDPGL